MNRCRISTYIWDLENGTDEPVGRAGIVTQTDNECVDTAGEGEVGGTGRLALTHTTRVKQLEGGCNIVEGLLGDDPEG